MSISQNSATIDSMDILSYLLVLILAAFLGGVLAKLLKQPPVVGYLISGLVLGNLFSGQTHEIVEFLSELGVVLLLFTLGLEFSWDKLRKVARVAVGGAVIQIILTTSLSAFFISHFGFSVYHSVFMAAAFSLSSTAVVVKMLAERGELDSLSGEIMIAWLIVQDLAVLPLMILLPTIGEQLSSSGFTSASFLVLLHKLLLSTLVLYTVVWLGRSVIPKMVGKLALLNSRELLLVGVFGISIAGALMTQVLGLSTALGAFLAGLLIASSSQTHAVFSEVRPLRDLFALLFFATLGFLVPQGFFLSHFPLILLITLIVVCIKFLVVLFLTLYLGSHAKTSFLVGVGLVEVGEFAFILSRVGLTTGVVTEEVHGMIISVALLSILFMPPLFLMAPTLYGKIRDLSKIHFRPLYALFFAAPEHKDTLPELPFKDHVVVCGYGRVGKYIGRALTMSGIPYLVVEYDQKKAIELREKGIETVYGDPADIDILDYAQVDKARAVVIAIPDYHTQSEVIKNSLKLNKKVKIYCRTHKESDQKLLYDLGVTEVVQPEFAAALSITDKILKSFGQKEKDIEGKMVRLKIEHGVG